MSQALRASYSVAGDESPASIVVRLKRALQHYAPRSADAHPLFRRALEDTLSRPGGLVRAALVLRTGQESGLSQPSAEQLACALEYWHIASLLLDDLPCMDDAEERRGRPCLHRVHGEATTVLVALALINRGYILVGDAFLEQPIGIRQDALATVEAAVGPGGLIGGQSRDLNYTPLCPAREIGRIAWQKTGMLFWLALALPSLAAGPSPAERRDLRAASVYWGLAYQAIDDLADFHQDGPDAHLDRPNLVRALGAKRTQAHIRRLLAQSRFRLAHLEAMHDRWSYLQTWHRDHLETRAAHVLAH